MLKKKIFFSGIFLIFSFWSFSALGYTNPGAPVGFVNDFADILSSSDEEILEEKLAFFSNTTGNEIAITTIKSLDGDTIENYAVKLFEEWGIGDKEKDTGVLLLVAVDDREMRIEVGYGLEGALTDIQSSLIIRNILTPAFQANDFIGGISDAVDAIISVTKGEILSDREDSVDFADIFTFAWVFIFVLPWLAAVLGRSMSWWTGGVVGGVVGIVASMLFGFLYIGAIALVLLVLFGLFFDRMVSKAYKEAKASGKKSPWWAGGGGGSWGSGSGSSGGGFDGFGGGSSGGGGASGKW